MKEKKGKGEIEVKVERKGKVEVEVEIEIKVERKGKVEVEVEGKGKVEVEPKIQKVAAKPKKAKSKLLTPPAATKAAVNQKKKATAPVKELKKYSFFEDVWDVARQIPQGRVTNYGAIAKYLGSGLSSRMVGWAMNAVGGDETIPAQRVVNRNGILSAKAHFGCNRMQELLEADGVKVENDTVVDFKKIHWDPAVELGL